MEQRKVKVCRHAHGIGHNTSYSILLPQHGFLWLCCLRRWNFPARIPARWFCKSITSSLLFLSSRISEIENELGVAQPPLLSEHPSSTLYDAATRLIQTHARRLPLLDNDSETGHEVIVSVLTQYRLLKFISINVGSPSLLFIFHLFDIHHSVIRRFKISIYLYENSGSAPMSLLLHMKFLKVKILIIQSPLQALILVYSMLFTCSRNVRSRRFPSSMRKV